MFRYFVCLLGLLLALPLLGLILLALTLPVTLSGIGYLLAGSLTVLGWILAPRGEKLPLVLMVSGLIAIAGIASARLILAGQSGRSRLTVITLPQGKETRGINTLIDEQDNLIVGEAIFHLLGGDSAREHEHLATALHRTYSEMRRTRQVFPSPVLSTYLYLQRPGAFDAVIIEPEVARRPETAVIFLHGFMGNVAAQCWEIARAVEPLGSVTVCPSADWMGQWWQPEGEAILQATFQALRKQGVKTFYLGGFSNGGFGISRLASKVSTEAGLRGLFFINGISSGVSLRETGLPVLIIQAAQDQRVPAESTRQVAKAIGDLATYVEVEGDHFVIIKQPGSLQAAITTWLETLTGTVNFP